MSLLIVMKLLIKVESSEVTVATSFFMFVSNLLPSFPLHLQEDVAILDYFYNPPVHFLLLNFNDDEVESEFR